MFMCRTAAQKQLQHRCAFTGTARGRRGGGRANLPQPKDPKPGSRPPEQTRCLAHPPSLSWELTSHPSLSTRCSQSGAWLCWAAMCSAVRPRLSHTDAMAVSGGSCPRASLRRSSRPSLAASSTAACLASPSAITRSLLAVPAADGCVSLPVSNWRSPDHLQTRAAAPCPAALSSLTSTPQSTLQGKAERRSLARLTSLSVPVAPWAAASGPGIWCPRHAPLLAACGGAPAAAPGCCAARQPVCAAEWLAGTKPSHGACLGGPLPARIQGARALQAQAVLQGRGHSR